MSHGTASSEAPGTSPDPGASLHHLLVPGCDTRQNQPLPSVNGWDFSCRIRKRSKSRCRVRVLGVDTWGLPARPDTTPSLPCQPLQRQFLHKTNKLPPKKSHFPLRMVSMDPGMPVLKSRSFVGETETNCRVTTVLSRTWARVPPGPAQVFVSITETNDGTGLSPSTESGL